MMCESSGVLRIVVKRQPTQFVGQRDFMDGDTRVDLVERDQLPQQLRRRATMAMLPLVFSNAPRSFAA